MAAIVHGTERVQATTEGGGLPITVKIRSSLFGTLVSLVAAGLFIAVPFIFRQSGQLDGGGAWQWLIWLFPLIGVVALACSLRHAGRSTEAEIGPDAVQVRGRSLFGGSEWREPLAAYDGIRWRQDERVANSDNERHDKSNVTTIQRVELAHADGDKIVPLFAGTVDDAAARQEWERFARATGLPAIDARDVTQTVRAAEDIDKSVKELAAEGKIDAEWRNEAPPGRIDLSHSGNAEDAQAMTLTLPPAIPDKVWRALQAGAALVLLLGLFEMSLFLILVAAGFGGLFEFIRRSQHARPRSFHLTRDTLTYTEPTRSDNDFTMPLSQIESIDVTRAQIGHIDAGARVKAMLRKVLSHNVLVIGSDQAEHRVAGLTKDELAWLRRFLRAAVAHA